MRPNKRRAAAIGVLFLITAAVAAIHLSGRISTPENTLRIESEGKVTELALEDLTSQEVHGTTINGKGEERTIDAHGVPLSDVLAQAGITRYTQVTVTADDEYSAAVTAEEAGAPDRAFLLLEAGERPRLVVFGDPNSKRNVSGVVRLIVQ